MTNQSAFVDLACPQCGKQLVGTLGMSEAQLGDMLSCPTHGNVGRFDELAKKLGGEFARQASNKFRRTP